MALDVELLPLADGLRSDRQRGEDQHRPAGVAGHVLGPCELHGGLAQAAIRKDRGAALAHGPLHESLLEVKQLRRHEHWVEAVISAGVQFALQKGAVVR
ncbi:MAG: hypothetical protein EBV32_04390 [Proteobacteria bacterium]|uniref:Uncharacterized protein n=1 Tax=Candidatus Fonsibacter lacus TaxID=2576439 RepID=A0A964UYW2_9PROT|nr:hypothetical protein [Candidatus Fonsibacter lacus]